MERCESVSELSSLYSIFIIDQWGVLHDGAVATADAIKSIEYLKRQQKLVAVLTNSGKSYRSNIARLGEFGYRSDQFDLVLTSGDIAIEFIKKNYFGTKIYWIDEKKDFNELSEIGENVLVDRIDLADLIYLSGWNEQIMEWDVYVQILAQAAKNNTPMICSNPDIEGFSNGRRDKAPGWIAERFAEMGGNVRLFGKPNKSMFEICLSRLGVKDPQLAIVIGDSFRTDICGAANAGIASVLIESGLHRDLFEHENVDVALKQLSRQYSDGFVKPNYVMRRLR